MKIILEQIWSASFYPWQSDEPWNTVLPDGQITLSHQAPSLKYGIKILDTVKTLTLSNPTPTLKYGIKFLADVKSLVLSTPIPQRIGAFWARITKPSTIWTDINKTSGEIWEDYGTILWSWRNQPWLSTYFPWLEKGGTTPITTYTNEDKPTTTYQDISKPTTNYNQINKPQI